MHDVPVVAWTLALRRKLLDGDWLKGLEGDSHMMGLATRSLLAQDAATRVVRLDAPEMLGVG